MAHSIEPATSGRAKCRGCGRPIDKGELRLGEQLPNPFAEGEMILWFHLTCAAYKRPEAYARPHLLGFINTMLSGVEAAFLGGNTMITIQQTRVRAFVAGVSFVPAPILPQFYQVFLDPQTDHLQRKPTL